MRCDMDFSQSPAQRRRTRERNFYRVLVFFLLLNLTQTEKLPESKDVRLPESSALAETRDTVIVSISRDEILVQDVPVAKVADVLASTEPLIASLHTALDALPLPEKPVAAADTSVAATTEPAPRELTVMGDREIPYQLLRKVLATCADAGFEGISLAVLQRATPVGASQPIASLLPK